MGGVLVAGGKLISTAASLIGQDSAEKKYYRSLAKTADEQARQTEENARRNANYMFEDAAYQNTQLSRSYSSLLGKQKTALAASGLSGNSATAQLILKNSRLNALMDQETLNGNVSRAIYENNTQAALQAQQYRTQAQQYRSAVKNRIPFWGRLTQSVGGFISSLMK